MNTLEQAKQALANKRLFAVVFGPEAAGEAAYVRFRNTGSTRLPVNPAKVAEALRDVSVFQAAYGHLSGWRELHQRVLSEGAIPTVPPKSAPVAVGSVVPVAKAPPVTPKVEPTAARLAVAWRVKTHHVLAALAKLEIWVEPHTPLQKWQVEAVRAHMLDAYLAGTGVAPQK